MKIHRKYYIYFGVTFLLLAAWEQAIWTEDTAHQQCRKMIEAHNYEQAFQACRQAADREVAQAVNWFRKAAARGFADAQTTLGWMYAGGVGVMQSGAAAADCYYKAGVSYLRQNDRDNALLSIQRIRDLQSKHQLNVPNALLADKLREKIYSDGNAIPPRSMEGQSHNRLSQ